MITKLVPKAAKQWLKTRIKNSSKALDNLFDPRREDHLDRSHGEYDRLHLQDSRIESRKDVNIAREDKLPFAEIKYIPYKFWSDSFLIPKTPALDYETCSLGLAIPPPELWFGYGTTKEAYLSSGEKDSGIMLGLLRASNFSLANGDSILDFGCGAGRMIRHLKNFSESCEIWGTDISAECIYWCKQHLSPPFHFATTTTIPHLPFKDSYFNFIYGASVFTHIDDLAEAWLLELRRILSPNGRLYLTIHDNRSIELLEATNNEDFFLAKLLKTHDLYIKSKNTLGMLAMGRDIHAQVFYDIDYFCKTLSSMYRVLSITKEAYGYQTAVLAKPK